MMKIPFRILILSIIASAYTIQISAQDLTTEQKKNPQCLELKNIPGNSQVDVKWIVKGGREYIVRVESAKGGRASGQSK